MFEGVYTALATPFHEDGSIDEDSLRRLVDRQIEDGVQGLVPMGTTGESPTLDHDEHIQVIRMVIEEGKGRVPVIAGTGSNSTREAVELSRRAKDAGVDATLHVAPYYNKPTQEGLYRHYRTIADEVDLPIIVYNIPSRTGRNIENPTMLQLAQHERIVAVKDATGDFKQLMDFIRQKPDSFDVLSGDDNVVLAMIALGARGVISVASNLIPDAMARFVRLALDGKMEKARREHYRLLPLFNGLFIETNPIPIKTAMALKGLMKETFRLPMCPLAPENRAKLVQLLEDLDIL
jgi:4-hydroxy-tetrahydrodipicolinate synthase